MPSFLVRSITTHTLQTIPKFDDVLTEDIEDGANAVHRIEFRTTDLRKHRNRARALAITAAREKAEALSKECGRLEPESIQGVVGPDTDQVGGVRTDVDPGLKKPLTRWRARSGFDCAREDYGQHAGIRHI